MLVNSGSMADFRLIRDLLYGSGLSQSFKLDDFIVGVDG